MGLTKTNPKIKLGLVEPIPKISAQYLLWGLNNWFFSVGLGSKWLTGGRLPLLVLILLVGFCDNNVNPSSLALFHLGLRNSGLWIWLPEIKKYAKVLEIEFLNWAKPDEVIMKYFASLQTIIFSQ